MFRNRFAQFIVFGVVATTGLAALSYASSPQDTGSYEPKPVFCAKGDPNRICPVIPGKIGPDKALFLAGYQGLLQKNPQSADGDVQTPFDNFSWQTFVALNLPGGQNWQHMIKVEQVFGRPPVTASCPAPARGVPVMRIGATRDGHADGHGDEYIQASTGAPVIDVNGNWAIYERRINIVELAYLQRPKGNARYNLTSPAGQAAFRAAGLTVDFPNHTTNNLDQGAIELKLAWRILDPANRAENMRKYIVTKARLEVAPSLVDNGKPICADVQLGLVAMHIIEKNEQIGSLQPEWIWATFEHVDNAPLAAAPCDVSDPLHCPTQDPAHAGYDPSCPPPASNGPTGQYAFFNDRFANLPTNQAPQRDGAKAYLWHAAQPYAERYMTPVAMPGGKVGTQVSRCWAIYSMTRKLNAAWQAKLAGVNLPLKNYMLVGTQWGAHPERPLPLPEGVPNFLSNTLLETYLQRAYSKADGFNTGGCIACHKTATFRSSTVPTDLSFLPSLVGAEATRRTPILTTAH